MTLTLLRSSARAGLGLLAAALLAGCAGAPRWGAWSNRPSPEQFAAASHPPATKVLYKDGVYGAQQ